MPSILIDPAYEAEILRLYVSRVQRLVDQTKATGLTSVPVSVLQQALQPIDEQKLSEQLGREQADQLAEQEFFGTVQ
jgi:hypothetical protein